MAIKSQLKAKWSKPILVVLMRREDSIGSSLVWAGWCKNSNQGGPSSHKGQCYVNGPVTISGFLGPIQVCSGNCNAQTNS